MEGEREDTNGPGRAYGGIDETEGRGQAPHLTPMRPLKMGISDASSAPLRVCVC
jgi:hypothetical protein